MRIFRAFRELFDLYCIIFPTVFCFGLIAGCAHKPPKLSPEPIVLRHVACQNLKSGETTCACYSPVFSLNAQTGKDEIQCGNETKGADYPAPQTKEDNLTTPSAK